MAGYSAPGQKPLTMAVLPRQLAVMLTLSAILAIAPAAELPMVGTQTLEPIAARPLDSVPDPALRQALQALEGQADAVAEGGSICRRSP